MTTPGEGTDGPAAHRAAGGERAGRLRHHWPALVWLCLLWVLLWGTVSLLVLASGLLMAVVVVALFPLPPVVPWVRIRPVRMVGLIAHLTADLCGAAVTVAWHAVYRGPRTRTAIVEVPLRIDSDFLITSTAYLTTMVPGTLVLEVDRDHLLLYVHCLPVRDPAQAGHRRREVRDAEQRVVRAFGVTEALHELERRREAHWERHREEPRQGPEDDGGEGPGDIEGGGGPGQKRPGEPDA